MVESRSRQLAEASGMLRVSRDPAVAGGKATMTLDEAIGNAFGLSEFVRRASWPEGRWQ